MKKGFLLSIFIVIMLMLATSIFLFENKSFNKVNLSNLNIEDLALQAVLAAGDEIIFNWDEGSDDVSYYILYHGVNSDVYGESIKTNGKTGSLALDTSNFNSYIHYFALTAVDAYGNESDYSKEVKIDLDPEMAGTCGNGLREEENDEICDGGYKLCDADDNYKGVKACKADCSGWQALCMAMESCGDGLVNGNEKCDPNAKVDSFIYCNEAGLLGQKYCDEITCQYGACQVNEQAF